MDPIGILLNLFSIITLLSIAAVIIGIIMGAAYCFVCPIEFNQILYGPALFLYTTHDGDYISAEFALDRFERALDMVSAKEIIARHLDLSIYQLTLIRAAVYVRNAKVRTVCLLSCFSERNS